MNSVALPELERLAKQDKPFLLFMRHMDPHSPYLPPEPFSESAHYAEEYSRPKGVLNKPVVQDSIATPRLPVMNT